MNASRLPAASPFLLLLPLLLWGCGGEDSRPPSSDDPSGSTPPTAVDRVDPPAAPPGVTSVLLHLEEGAPPRLLLEPCRDGAEGPGPDARPVEDATGRELAEMIRSFGSPEGGIRARVVVEGDQVTHLRIAPPEVPDCDWLLSGGDVVASGNEPFWHLVVDGGDATWSTPEEVEGVNFFEGRWERPEEGWRFEAQRDFVDGMEYLVLRVLDTPCMDTMSGARYPWTAVAERGGARWEGCAREGR